MPFRKLCHHYHFPNLLPIWSNPDARFWMHCWWWVLSAPTISKWTPKTSTQIRAKLLYWCTQAFLVKTFPNLILKDNIIISLPICLFLTHLPCLSKWVFLVLEDSIVASLLFRSLLYLYNVLIEPGMHLSIINAVLLIVF